MHLVRRRQPSRPNIHHALLGSPWPHLQPTRGWGGLCLSSRSVRPERLWFASFRGDLPLQRPRPRFPSAAARPNPCLNHARSCPGREAFAARNRFEKARPAAGLVINFAHAGIHRPPSGVPFQPGSNMTRGRVARCPPSDRKARFWKPIGATARYGLNSLVDVVPTKKPTISPAGPRTLARDVRAGASSG